jgi:predicted house-cleaning noncanonical NTP pyrophosphatase (MazG superfamily)
MKIYNKLVRDKIPEIIKANGENPKTRVLSTDEYFDELIKKLCEEAEELRAEPGLEELADVQEVVNAILDFLHEDQQALEKMRVDKAGKRGAFKQKLFLESVE